MNVTLRPINDLDSQFVRRLYGEGRADELAVLDWSDDEKRVFLDSQFEAQSLDYARNYPNASFDLIELGGRPIGRLLVDRPGHLIHIIDIALLSEQRGRGIGSDLLRSIIQEAKETKVPVRIHVEHLNPARRLYDRLGFRLVEDLGIYHLMEWNEDAPT